MRAQQVPVVRIPLIRLIDSSSEMESFRCDPSALVAEARKVEKQIGDAIDFQIKGSEAEKEVTAFFKTRMQEKISDQTLLKGSQSTPI